MEINDRFKIWNKEHLEKVFDQIRAIYDLMNTILLIFDETELTEPLRSDHYVFIEINMRHQIDTLEEFDFEELDDIVKQIRDRGITTRNLMSLEDEIKKVKEFYEEDDEIENH